MFMPLPPTKQDMTQCHFSEKGIMNGEKSCTSRDGRLFGVLWHINLCRLSNTESIHIKLVLFQEGVLVA